MGARISHASQLEGRLLVEGDQRELHLERRLIQPIHDELDLLIRHASATARRAENAGQLGKLEVGLDETELGPIIHSRGNCGYYFLV